MLNEIKEIYKYRTMLINMVKRDLRTRYKASVLGFLWTFINPLLQLVIYTVIFSTIMRANVENYAMFLFVTLIPWICFSTAMLTSTNIVISNSNLIKKIYFPRTILPIATAVSGLVNMLFSFLIVFIALFIFRIHIGMPLLALPIVMIIEFIFTLGICFIVSAVNVYFRDMEHILGIVSMGWFYLTPIIYPVNMIPQKYMKLFFLNPMTSIILPYRDILFNNIFPDAKLLFVSFLISIGVLVFGYTVYQKLQRGFAEEI
jgi:lipopolysaccharide transport system permease protein